MSTITKKWKETDLKKWIIMNAPYAILAYFFAKLAELYHHMSGMAVEKLFKTLANVHLILKRLYPTFTLDELLFGISLAVVIRVMVLLTRRKKKYRNGVEYGASRWGTKSDIEPYVAKEFYNNIILSETEFLTMSGRMENPEHNRNKNVLATGGSGTGKTRFVVKPNIMQMHSSYVITDPKGTLLTETGKLLARGTPKKDEQGKTVYEPYKIKVLNLLQMDKSMHYNPFHYIKSEKDILKLVNTLIANTTGEGQKSSEKFWEDAERLYYYALIGYIWYEGVEEEKNFATLLELISASEVREEDDGFKNPVDLLFEDLESRESDHFAVRQYKKFKLAAGKTAKGVLISCAARLAPFDIRELRELTSFDELGIDTLGDEKQALFVITDDTDDTFDFLSAIMYTQAFNLLCDKALKVYGGRLPVHVRFILDEFANIYIPKFEKLISVIRSREISATIMLQTKSQLKAKYKENAETIQGNCDTEIFLGGKEKTTLKDIEEALGDETIDLFNESEQRSNQKSYGLNYQKLGRKLMSVFELNVLPRGKCVVQVSGLPPFRSNKYDIAKHPRYQYLEDFDKKNAFDVNKYLEKQRIKNSNVIQFKLNEEFEVYEADFSKAEKKES